MKISGRQLRTIRELMRMPQQKLARLSGVNKAYISEFETGARDLPEADVQKLVRILLAPAEGTAYLQLTILDEGAPILRVLGNHIYGPEYAVLTWIEPRTGETRSQFVGSLLEVVCPRDIYKGLEEEQA